MALVMVAFSTSSVSASEVGEKRRCVSLKEQHAVEWIANSNAPWNKRPTLRKVKRQTNAPAYRTHKWHAYAPSVVPASAMVWRFPMCVTFKRPKFGLFVWFKLRPKGKLRAAYAWRNFG